ncbi:MAG: hypothetical protein H7841_17380 [Magnetospirillum sp. WYHS-4]
MSDPRFLEYHINQLRAEVGNEAVDSLLTEFAGQELYVPKKARPHQPIADACGMPLAKALARMRGGEYIRIPGEVSSGEGTDPSDLPEIDPRYLPPLLSELCDRVGPSGVARLVKEFGGQEIYIPIHPRKGQRLVEKCGMDVAMALADLRSGEHSHQSIPRAAVLASKKLAITALAGRGLSTQAIAKEVGSTSRYVRMVMSGSCG